jgi:hypothetical protein
MLALKGAMSAIVSSPPVVLGASKARSIGLRAIEKASAFSALGHGKSNDDNQRQKTVTPVQVELVYRDDTPGFDPFWDAPRLVSTFVAQLLGQAMPKGPQNAMPNTAYGPMPFSHRARLVDFNS